MFNKRKDKDIFYNKTGGTPKIFPTKNRKGQFFLIAAVVIIVVIVSVVTISNYTTQKQTTKLYDLGKELGIESQNVLDYGTYSQYSDDQMKTLMEQFIKNYHNYQEQDKNIYFIFGNSNKVNILGYQDIHNVQETVCINLDPPSQKKEDVATSQCKYYTLIGSTQTFCKDTTCLTTSETINRVAVMVAEDIYEFKLKSGQNFYFIIWQEIGGGRNVVTSEQT